LSPLRQIAFQVDTQYITSLHDITPLTLPEAANSRLVFINGVYAPDLSAVADLPDSVVVSNLAGLPLGYHSRVQNYLAQHQGAKKYSPHSIQLA
jgi:Fe-S cluster assembly protein SufD